MKPTCSKNDCPNEATGTIQAGHDKAQSHAYPVCDDHMSEAYEIMTEFTPEIRVVRFL